MYTSPVIIQLSVVRLAFRVASVYGDEHVQPEAMYSA